MKKEEIIEINKRQTEFYNNKKKNFVTKVWFSLRNGLLQTLRKQLGVERELIQLHKEWLNDISHKKVLDLGCYEGNSLSYYLAKNSHRYIAIDLSEKGISKLKTRLADLQHAEAYTMDFLSEDFQEKNFDIIYAYGVLHHFKDLDFLITKLNEKLSPGGKIISYDPLVTSFPVKIARGIYRPFQSDREWEWPFNKKGYYKFAAAFVIRDRRGMLGRVKKMIFLNFLPLSQEKKIRIAKKWHKKDWEDSRISDTELFRCMHITMLMQKKE